MIHLGDLRLTVIIVLLFTSVLSKASGLDESPGVPAQESQPDIWQAGIGTGFKRNVDTLSVQGAVAKGLTIFGSQQAHDLALVNFSHGHMLGGVRGENHWYRGNWEFRAELFAGGQYSPSREWLVGITPCLRYNFATGTRLIPFLDLGGGASGTGIGKPDLSTRFEFNLLSGFGAHWFLFKHLALTAEARLFHLSNGSLHVPNLGANAVMGMAGVTWFF